MSLFRSIEPKSKLVVGLVLLNVLLSGTILLSRWIGAGCSACATGLWLPLGGILAYSGVLALLLTGKRPILTDIILATIAGCHVGLIVAMVALSSVCPICVGIGVISLIATVLKIGRVTGRKTLIYGAIPLSASIAFLLALPHVWLMQESLPPQGIVKLVVYEQPGCGACTIFRDSIAPNLSKEAVLVNIDYREVTPADLLVRKTPTVIVFCHWGKTGVILEPLNLASVKTAIAGCQQ